MRISNQTIIDTVLNNLSSNTRRLLQLQEQVSSGKRVRRPSDDPTRLHESLGFRTRLAQDQQFLRNIDSAQGFLTANESAFSQLTDIVQRARELAIQGSTDVLSAQQKANIAVEIDQLLQQAIQVGNTSFNGRYIFAGQQTTTAPFTPVGSPISSVTYNGDANQILSEIGIGTTLQINVPGNQVFPGVFTALIQLRDDLQANNTAAITADVSTMDTVLESVLQTRGQIGAEVNRAEASQSRLQESVVNMQQLISNAEDVDFADVVTKLAAQQNVFQAALGATARVIQPSLVQFLK